LHAEGEPCYSATLVNYHLTKTYNFNEQACLETSSPDISIGQLSGFFLANIFGMLIVLLSVQFYKDVLPSSRRETVS
jgi:hypothetical protein